MDIQVGKVKKIGLIVWAIISVALLIGTLSFRKQYKDLLTQIENVIEDETTVSLRTDLDNLQSNFDAIQVELNSVKEERDNVEQLERKALDAAASARRELELAAADYAKQTDSSSKIRALLIGIEKATFRLK